ncbi:hypothetical protein WICPIJ_008508 [Wickerhamomyces pijperi]|uniref:tRNA ligase n=1 Tax=Wickerhamomyces pijperi TaxID=599730 RepID=A0A9P8PWW2_WICPI|nr:hypothetical protein WICPIJ_008508 [Wickerhamomyces pijperi]
MSNKDHQTRDTAELISQLEQATQLKGKGKCIKKIFQISGTQRNLISWKFNEWDYGKEKIKLPSNARGLFTLEDQPVLAVRGYDKFFNINEVAFTRWDWLAENTQGPYYVTSKENGCIILVSGLSDGTLVVCSKHSTGSRDDVERNHATSGQDFLREQLQARGVTERDFALKLHEMNATAVCELCDDAFEEHIVEYKGQDSGLYLHGLNLNKPIFETLSIEAVNQFSQQYGFKTIDYFTENSLGGLKQTLDEHSKVGSYKGKEIEGFVIRCKLLSDSSDYFFKFKFEEPYLMYRQWREATRTYIHTRLRSELRFNKHKFITNKYLDFVIPILETEPQTCADYLQGKGQIELRQRFLAAYGMTGSEILNQERVQELEELNAFDKLQINDDSRFIFVPVATVGCGKTTTALTLTHLFADQFGIVINDNISKQNKAAFFKQPLEILKQKKAVFMDRNNHQYRERKQIFDEISKCRDDYLPYDTNVQFIALNFVTDDLDEAELWRTTTQRVFERGDNHQSIKVATDGKKVAESIMSGFIKRFQPINTAKEPDCAFDLVIDMKVSSSGDSSLENAKLIVEQIHSKYPVLIPELPTTQQIDAAFSKALNYKPTFTKMMGNGGGAKKEKTRRPTYFSTRVQDVPGFLAKISSALQSKHKSEFFEFLQLNNRVQEEFHVTLAHVAQTKAGTAQDKEIWNEYLKVFQTQNGKKEETQAGKPKACSSQSLNGIKADIKLKSIVFDTKAMAINVELLRIHHHPSTESDTNTVLNLKCMNKFPHITIGTATASIKPFYSNQLIGSMEVYDFKEGEFGDSLNNVLFEDSVVLENLKVFVNF